MDSNLLEKNVGYGYAFIAALPYLIIHLMCFGVFFIEISPSGFIIFLVSYWIRIFGVGAGYHRLFAHRSFKTSRFFQFFLAILGASALQRGVLWWASTHRVHHCHADTEQDLHSPKHQGFFYSYLGWVLHPREKKTNLDLVPDLKKYTELVWLDKKPVWISISVLYAVGVTLLFGAEGFFWGFCISTVAIWHTVHWIQTFSHTWSGYRRFKTQDDSRNHWLLGIFSLGEYHNNHHFYPYSAKQGVVWWEIDIVYHVLKVLEFFGIVWDIKLPK